LYVCWNGNFGAGDGIWDGLKSSELRSEKPTRKIPENFKLWM
jgi:hypothetical protein